jgi:aminocarboxymuconate-semialdehyde decarboxylase
MQAFVDLHCHVSPQAFPAAPEEAVRGRWPCMRCLAVGKEALMVGETMFRELDSRSWDVARRIEDMDRDKVSMQVLSPMPELLSYWFEPGVAQHLCDASNHQIAEMMARAPRRFRGLGAVPLQDPMVAATQLPRLQREFGLSGVEIGSNINGIMLGDARFNPFWEAAEALGMAVFVHALHPVAAKPIQPAPFYIPFALFPVDVAMAVSSVLMAGVMDRFPGLRLGFSHGGGAMTGILGRLDTGWSATNGFGGKGVSRPSEAAQNMFYDSNVYDPVHLRYLAEQVVPGRVFAGTDYPYDIMQRSPADFVESAGLSDPALASVRAGAAGAFLAEDLPVVISQ